MILDPQTIIWGLNISRAFSISENGGGGGDRQAVTGGSVNNHNRVRQPKAVSVYLLSKQMLPFDIV